MSTSQRRRSLPRLALLAIVAALALTGCVKIDGDFIVSPNDTVDGTLVLGVDKQAAPMMGGQIDPQTFNDLPDGATATKWSNANYTGTKVTYDNVALSEFTSPSTGGSPNNLALTHKNGQFILNGTLDLTESATGGGDEFGAELAQQALASADMRMRFTFPGEVAETNGTVSEDGRTVTYNLEFGAKNSIRAVADDGSGLGWLPWVLIGVGGAGVLGSAVGLMFTRRTRDEPVENVAAIR